MKRVKKTNKTNKKATKTDKKSKYYETRKRKLGGPEDKKVGELLNGGQEYWFEERCKKIKNLKRTKLSQCRMKYTPEELHQAATEYFRYVETHPLYERKIAGTYMGEPMMVDLPKRRVMTINGLLIFLEIGFRSWYNYYQKMEIFEHVLSFIDMVIRDQKFVGAASGFFKEAMIMRDLGMVDRQDVTTKGDAIKERVTINNNMSVKDAEKAYKQLIFEQQG